MTGTSVDVSELRIPVDAVRRLSAEQRYVYYLLGLIHNESMMLRKLISFSLAANRDMRRFKREPEIAQTLFLFRIGCCKLWEAQLKLNMPEVQGVMDVDVYPHWPEGPSERKALNKMMHEAGWLYTLRNRIGFHYPSFEDWLPFTTPNSNWEDDVVYAGEEAGNQFLDAPEAIVRHQMFSAAHGDTPADQMDTWVGQAVDLLVKLSDFTEHAVWHFSMARLLPGEFELKHLGKVNAPRLDEVVIPFWTRPPSKKKRTG